MEARNHQIFESLTILNLWDLRNIIKKYDYYFYGVSKVIREVEEYLLTQTGVILLDGNIAINTQNNILIYDLKRQNPVTTLSGHTRPINKLKVLSNGDIVSSSHDKAIRLWNGITFKCYDILNHSLQITDFVILSDDTIVSISETDLTVWTSGEKSIVLSEEVSISCIAVLDSKRIVTGAFRDNLRIWNSVSQICEKVFDNSNNVTALLILKDIIVTGNEDGSISLYNRDTHLDTIEPTDDEVENNMISHLCRISDTLIASGSDNGTVRIWNLKYKEHVHTFTVQLSYNRESDAIQTLLTLPNGNLVIGSWDPTMYIYNPFTGIVVYSFPEESDTVDLLLLKDNRFINVMSNGSLKMWE